MLKASSREVSVQLSERLKDPYLFRQQAFVAGAWVDADERHHCRVDPERCQRSVRAAG
jgi:histidine ammonia-lyase